MNSTTLLTIAYQWGPVLFGIAFVAPLVAQTLEAGGFAAPFGVSEIQFGLVVGFLGGLVAKRRGTWV